MSYEANIIKTKLKNGFFIADLAVLNSKDLSPLEKVVFFMFCAKPKDWHLSQDNLACELEINPSTLRRALKNLENYGFLRRERVKNQVFYIIGQALQIVENSAAQIESNSDLIEFGADSIESDKAQKQGSKTDHRANLHPCTNARHNNKEDSTKKEKESRVLKNELTKNDFLQTKFENTFLKAQTKEFQFKARLILNEIILKEAARRGEKSTKAKSANLQSAEAFSAAFGEFSEKEQSKIKEFIDYRREIKHNAISPKGYEYQAKGFKKLKESGADICECINSTMERGYLGVFSVNKGDFKGKKQAKKDFNKPHFANELNYYDKKAHAELMREKMREYAGIK